MALEGACPLRLPLSRCEVGSADQVHNTHACSIRESDSTDNLCRSGAVRRAALRQLGLDAAPNLPYNAGRMPP
jgi:hypothetical protein